VGHDAGVHTHLSTDNGMLVTETPGAGGFNWALGCMALDPFGVPTLVP
jgi:hypothetical protein